MLHRIVKGSRRRLRELLLSRAQRRALTLVIPYTMLDRVRLVSLWDQVQMCERENIPGALVECGVWKGGAVGLMALASNAIASQPRHIHLFDAFDDISEPDPAVDGERALREVREWGGLADPAGRLRPITGIYAAEAGTAQCTGAGSCWRSSSDIRQIDVTITSAGSRTWFRAPP